MLLQRSSSASEAQASTGEASSPGVLFALRCQLGRLHPAVVAAALTAAAAEFQRGRPRHAATAARLAVGAASGNYQGSPDPGLSLSDPRYAPFGEADGSAGARGPSAAGGVRTASPVVGSRKSSLNAPTSARSSSSLEWAPGQVPTALEARALVLAGALEVAAEDSAEDLRRGVSGGLERALPFLKVGADALRRRLGPAHPRTLAAAGALAEVGAVEGAEWAVRLALATRLIRVRSKNGLHSRTPAPTRIRGPNPPLPSLLHTTAARRHHDGAA